MTSHLCSTESIEGFCQELVYMIKRDKILGHQLSNISYIMLFATDKIMCCHV